MPNTEYPMLPLSDTSGMLTLIGSGEFSPSMAETHRVVMRMIDGAVKPAFIDTPAGFELNLADICDKAVLYFKQNFDLDLAIASFPNAKQATPLSMEEAMRTLRRSNYLLAGPGSPTYAARNWRGTPIFETMVGKLAAGAQLVLASAATLSLGRFTLPVYEIYKVGEDPHWVEGLDLLGRYGLDLAIVPHWNNNSGSGHDTSRCYVGQSRFDTLRSMLPPTTVVLGIDEYTACMLSPKDQLCRVHGAGVVTIQRNDGEKIFKQGDTFGFDLLQNAPNASSKPNTVADHAFDFFEQMLREKKPASAVGYVHALSELMRQTNDANALLVVREMLAALAIWLEDRSIDDTQTAQSSDDEFSSSLMNLFLETRQRLRKDKQFAAADALRDRLASLGIEVNDTPEGSTWKRK